MDGDAGCLKLSDLSGLSRQDTIKTWRVNQGRAGAKSYHSSGALSEAPESARSLSRYSKSEAASAAWREASEALPRTAEAVAAAPAIVGPECPACPSSPPSPPRVMSTFGSVFGISTREARKTAEAAAGDGTRASLNHASRSESEARDEVLDAVCDLPPNDFWRRRSSRESSNLSRGSSDGSGAADRLLTPGRALDSPARRSSYDGLRGWSPERRLSLANMWLDQSTSFSEDEEDDYEMADGQVSFT